MCNPIDLLRVFFHGWQWVVKGRKEGEHADGKSNRESDESEVLEAKGFETEELTSLRMCCCLSSYMRGSELGAFLVIFHVNDVNDMKGVAMLRQVTYRK
jgi:hypothetical protein